MATQHDEAPGKPPLRLSRDMVFPLFGGRALWRRGHLLPVFVTIFVGLALLSVFNNGNNASGDALTWTVRSFCLLIALYVAFMINWLIYEMCGRATNWLLIIAVAFATYELHYGPLWHNRWYAIFNWVIPSEQWRHSSHFAVRLAGDFAGFGLGEESFKSLPLFAVILLGGGLAFLGRRAGGRLGAVLAALAKRVGLCGPLDGIVLGVASGSGFFIKENLAELVPNITHKASDIGLKAFDALAFLLARLLPQIGGHCAYSGLFGFYIGLAVLYPRKAVFLLPLGWASAALVHGLWDGFQVAPLQVFIGMLAYALMAGAIFKALEISSAATAPAARADGATIAPPRVDQAAALQAAPQVQGST